MIELSNELEQKINLKQEKIELEQKINKILVKSYKKYKDLQKFKGPEEYKIYKESKEEEEAYEIMKKHIDIIIKKHNFDKNFMEKLIKKYDSDEKIKKYLEELMQEKIMREKKNQILMNMV